MVISQKNTFQLKAPYKPEGDQPEAINKLTKGIEKGLPHQTLLGVTGSGKTYTLANVIAKTNLPTLIISHNKTLAAQLYQEFRDFFPNNAVSYFVSYYDYYQPEAYIPSTDTYIEKDASINDEIDKLRLSTTANLLSRPDCIVVASVSCIYNLGSPIEYGKNVLELMEGQIVDREVILRRLVDMQYSRLYDRIERGNFKVMGETILVWPANEDKILRIELEIKKIKKLTWLTALDFEEIKEDENEKSKRVLLYAAKHYVADPISREIAIKNIRTDLKQRLKELECGGKKLEAYRLEQKVNYDIDMIETMGFVNGIENYSRYFDGRNEGEAPFTLLDYMQHNADHFGKNKFLTVIDESHITIPQIRGMHLGDAARKRTLVDYGFRLPSAVDNRPLNFVEFGARVPQTIYTSATPEKYELSMSGQVVEQLIRPTGLLEPKIEVRPITGQIKDLVREIIERKGRKERVLVTVLTKKMAEDLAEYIKNLDDVKVEYLHSDVNTLDRADILENLRLGETDVIVGINLLREGLDLPEVSLVAILDADKEGFLRSKTSLVQTMGRAARHIEGKAILYADKMTQSMLVAIDEINRRREKQEKYNLENKITPLSIVKPIREKLLQRNQKGKKGLEIKEEKINPASLTPFDKIKLIKDLKKKMNQAAKNWEFEAAAKYRDLIGKLEK